MLVVALLLQACTVKDAAERRFAGAAGVGAKSCGMVPLRQDGASAVACTNAALKSGEPFYVGMQVRGIDSQIWIGFAHPKGQELLGVAYSSDVHGSDIPLIREPQFSSYSCPRPSFVPAFEGMRPTCKAPN